MTTKFWQLTKVMGVLVIGLGGMDAAQATYSSSYGTNCGGGGTTNPNCDTWTFNNTTTNTQGGIAATASGWANTVGSANVQLDTAYITLNGSSGLGVRNNDCTGYSNCTGGSTGRDINEGVSPEHAIDKRLTSPPSRLDGCKPIPISRYWRLQGQAIRPVLRVRPIPACCRMAGR
jgi:hypothetical protein